MVLSSLIIRRVSICESAFPVKFICKTPVSSQEAFTVIRRHAQNGKHSESPEKPTFPAEVNPGDTASCLSSPAVNKCPFDSLFGATFFTVVFLLLKGPQLHQRAVSSV